MEPDRLQLLKRIGITTMVVMVSALILTGVFAWITSEMGSFLFAMLSGALGAEISIIRRSPSMTDGEVGALVKSWWSVVIPLLPGAVMARVLYIAFMAGI